jgi:hypothetical protein
MPEEISNPKHQTILARSLPDEHKDANGAIHSQSSFLCVFAPLRDQK